MVGFLGSRSSERLLFGGLFGLSYCLLDNGLDFGTDFKEVLEGKNTSQHKNHQVDKILAIKCNLGDKS